MFFTETGLTAHFYLLLAGLTFLVFFIVYAFVIDHRTPVSKEWHDSFSRVDIPTSKIDKISHDDSMWYHAGNSTCVQYGDYQERCPKSEGVCAGKDGRTYGSREEQVLAVKVALDAGGVHPECPLIYS